MRQVLRVYLRHDYDLIGLRMQGVSLAKLAKIALEAYANGKRMHIFLDSVKKTNDTEVGSILQKESWNKKDDKKMAATFKCEFTTHDPNAERLLSNIKKGYRNQFVKTLIRNTLTEQFLSSFFSNETDVNNENAYLGAVNTDYIPNLIPAPMIGKKFNAEDYLVIPKAYLENKELVEIERLKEISQTVSEEPLDSPTDNDTENKATVVTESNTVNEVSETNVTDNDTVTKNIASIMEEPKDDASDDASDKAVSDELNKEVDNMFDSLMMEL